MFYDHDGVAFVPKFLEGRDKFDVVPLVEADRGLVQDVEDVYQFGTDLRGQPDPLAFPSGKGGCGPVQGEVFQSDVQHEFYPVEEFLYNVPRYRPLPVIQDGVQGSKPPVKISNLHCSHLGDGFSSNLEAFCLLIQTGSVADGTDDLVFDVAYDSGEGDHFRLVAFAYPEQFIRTVDEQAYGFLWDCRDGVVKGKVVFAGDRVDDVEFLRIAHLAEGDDAAVRY